MKSKLIVSGLAIIIGGLAAVSVMDAKAVNTDDLKSLHKGVDLTKLIVNSYRTECGVKRDMGYFVGGRYSKAISIGSVLGANSIGDLIHNYPSNWINEYISVEVSLMDNGVEKKAVGPNNVLTAEQKSLLSTSQLGTDLNISVKYKTENSVSKTWETTEMKVNMTVVPVVEAEYKEGYDAMILYLKDNTMQTLFDRGFNSNNTCVLVFNVNEDGKTSDIKITRSSENESSDELLVETISAMPNWKPAENADGSKVSQQFELRIGQDGC